MLAGRQSVCQAVSLHQDEADRIAQRPTFVQPLLQKRQRSPVKRLIHVNDGNLGAILQIGDKRESLCGRKPTRLRERNEFGQHITVGDSISGGIKERDGRSMLRFGRMM